MVEHNTIHTPHPDEENAPTSTLNFYLSAPMVEKIRNGELDASEVLHAQMELFLSTNDAIMFLATDRQSLVNLHPREVPYKDKKLRVQLCVAPPESMPISEPKNWRENDTTPEVVDKYCPPNPEVLHSEVMPQKALYDIRKHGSSYENEHFFNQRHLIDSHVRIRCSNGPLISLYCHDKSRTNDDVFFNWAHSVFMFSYSDIQSSESRRISAAFARLIDSGVDMYSILPSRRHVEDKRGISNLECAMASVGIDPERLYAQHIYEESQNQTGDSVFPASFFSELQGLRDDALSKQWENPMEINISAMMPHDFWRYDFMGEERVGSSALLETLCEREDASLKSRWQSFADTLPSCLQTPKGGKLKLYLSSEMMGKIRNGEVSLYDVARTQYAAASRNAVFSSMRYNNFVTEVELYEAGLEHTGFEKAKEAHAQHDAEYFDKRLPHAQEPLATLNLSQKDVKDLVYKNGRLNDVACFAQRRFFDAGACGRISAPEGVNADDEVFLSWADLDDQNHLNAYERTLNLRALINLGVDFYKEKEWLTRPLVDIPTDVEMIAAAAGISLERYYQHEDQSDDRFSDDFWAQIKMHTQDMFGQEDVSSEDTLAKLTPWVVCALDGASCLSEAIMKLNLSTLAHDDLVHLQNVFEACPEGVRKDYSHIEEAVANTLAQHKPLEPNWNIPAEHVTHEGHQAAVGGVEAKR